MNQDDCKNCEELIATLVRYHPEANVDLVERAYRFAEKAHEGQFRKSGEPYFTHPLTVASILAKLMLDAPTIAAGLLHDTVEDTDTSLDEVELHFGDQVRRLVEEVTDDKTLPKLERKRLQVEQAPQSSP